MTTLQQALAACRARQTGKGRHRRFDWETVVRAWFDCRNQHAIAQRLGMRQGRISSILRACGIRVGRGHRAPLLPLPLEEVCRRYQAGETTVQLGEAFGVDPEVIRQRMKKAGMKCRPSTRAGRGEANHQWKGGHTPPMHYHRRQSYEVAAICLGQPLPQGWVIHHCDEDPTNNDPSNLLIFQTAGAHARFHQLLLKRQRIEPTVDATRLALENGARPLPSPPAPIVLPPGTNQRVPSQTAL